MYHQKKVKYFALFDVYVSRTITNSKWLKNIACTPRNIPSMISFIRFTTNLIQTSKYSQCTVRLDLIRSNGSSSKQNSIIILDCYVI